MQITIKQGDVLDETADVLICSANPWLTLSGGVGGAILLRGGEGVQDELRTCLRESGRSAVESGSVIRTGAGPLNVKHILHVVAVDPFYGSSVDLVRKALSAALEQARLLPAASVVTPMLATGFGPLTAAEFGEVLAAIRYDNWFPIDELIVVVRHAEEAEALRSALT